MNFLLFCSAGHLSGWRQPPVLGRIARLATELGINIINQKDKKHFKSIGHHLSPIVTVAGKGLSESVIAELGRAISDHELIKIKVITGDRDERVETISQIKELLNVEVVQTIGKMALLYRAAKNPDPSLSNILRNKNL